MAWANFQVLRRTHASLGHDAEIDPKVAADQRGHGIGVALDVYTHPGRPVQALPEAGENSRKVPFSPLNGVKWSERSC